MATATMNVNICYLIRPTMESPRQPQQCDFVLDLRSPVFPAFTCSFLPRNREDLLHLSMAGAGAARVC